MRALVSIIYRIAALLALCCMLPAPAVADPAAARTMRVVKTGPANISPPLRELASLPAILRADIPLPSAILSAPEWFGSAAAIAQGGPAPLHSPAAIPGTIASFDGVNNVNSVAPASPQGAAGIDPATGTKYYVQFVNISFQIWNVTNPAAPVSLFGPSAGNTLWSGFGGYCESNNNGTPMVRFDHLANRWIMSQNAYHFGPPDEHHQCIAVSTTADPTGTWYRYDFVTGTANFPDIPRFGLWPDGYYMSNDQYGSSGTTWAGVGVFAFERAKMLNGEGAQSIYFDLGASNPEVSRRMLPSDLDGPAPAAGTPNYFTEWDDSATLGDVADTLRIWEFHVDWTTPANSTFGANTSFAPNTKITTQNVDPDMCGYVRACIPQPDTTNKVEAISGPLTSRMQFRDFGAYKTIVGNHTVDVTGSDQAGIHWFELRDSGFGWSLYQEGVFAPDTDNRWMGSIAMDGQGNIGLGYSVASAFTYPSVRYAGRLAGDTLGSLTLGEASIVAGGGSQTAAGNRWGTYSQMAIDPADDSTFWYTQQYFAVTSGWGWQTRIGAFVLCIDSDGDGYGDGCAAGPDCDDTNAAVHPAAAETCNGVDDNCNGQTDEGVQSPFYRDADGDTYGDAAVNSVACTAPAGYTDGSAGFDVDDTDAFYTDVLPDCTVKVIPRALGWLVGDKIKGRTLLVIAPRGETFEADPVIKWESDAITTVKTRVLFNRFLFIIAKLNGEPLVQQQYRLLIGSCEGSFRWAD